jgi:hypothetical protein
VVYSFDRISTGARPWKTYIAGVGSKPEQFQLRLNANSAYTTEDLGGIRAAAVPKAMDA